MYLKRLENVSEMYLKSEIYLKRPENVSEMYLKRPENVSEKAVFD